MRDGKEWRALESVVSLNVSKCGLPTCINQSINQSNQTHSALLLLNNILQMPANFDAVHQGTELKLLKPTILRVIESRRMRWAGHVARMGEGRGVYRVLVGKPEGKRPLGRPRRR